MIKTIKEFLTSKFLRNDLIRNKEEIKLSIGKILCEVFKDKNFDNIQDYEFKIFSQFGEDGIIQYLINNLNISSKNFIEFGVENYTEANTRFLLENDNWSGLILDSSLKNINFIKKQNYYWRFDVLAVHSFITPENINKILKDNNYEGNIGILSIDVDGNDYWILNAIEIVNPDILIIEYNANFGLKNSVSIKYQKNFSRSSKGLEKLIYGCSLAALNNLCKKKNYSLICCNKNGNNAFFVKNDLLNNKVKPISINKAYQKNSFKENFDDKGYPKKISSEEIIQILNSEKILKV